MLIQKQKLPHTKAASFFCIFLYSLVPDLSFVSVILRILTGSLSYIKLLLYSFGIFCITQNAVSYVFDS